MVPTAYPEAMNLNLPEYVLGSVFDGRSSFYGCAFNNGIGCDAMRLNAAAEQLDSFRSEHNLTMLPPASFFGQLPYIA